MRIEKLLSKGFINWLMKEAPPRNKLLSNIDRIKKEVQLGDVLLVEGRSRVSEVIKVITRSPWSHAALYIGSLNDIQDEQLHELAIKHLKKSEIENEHFVVEGVLGRGFIVTPLATYGQHHMRICRPDGLTQKDTQSVITCALKKVGKQYSTRHIFDLARFLLPWRIFPRRWRSSLFHYKEGGVTDEICTSMIAQAFESVNFPILPMLKSKPGNKYELIQRNPLLFAPCDFDYSPFFSIIKYPLLEEQLGEYKDLPWNNTITSQDNGEFTVNNKVN